MDTIIVTHELGLIYELIHLFRACRVAVRSATIRIAFIFEGFDDIFDKHTLTVNFATKHLLLIDCR